MGSTNEQSTGREDVEATAQRADAPKAPTEKSATGVPDESADRELSPGQQVGEYEIESKLGEGGFGCVYRAVHPLIGKNAAVKVLSLKLSADPEMVSRFVAEARAANTIRHDCIVDIFNFGKLPDGRHYFVMELLEGLTLSQFIEQRGPLDPPLVVEIMRGVSSALDAAHAKDIVHRDLKPDNVFLTFDPQGTPVPKLLDFGVAKLLGEAQSTSGHKTATGVPIGTPHYMSPEQCQGEAADSRVDVYALGVVCFEALTGRRPFEAGSLLELMYRQAHAERPLVSDALPELGTHFDTALCQMMAIDKAERPASPGEAFGLLVAAAQAAGYDVEATVSVAPQDRKLWQTAEEAAPTEPARRAAVEAESTDRVTTTEPVTAPARRSRTGLWLVGVTILGGAVAYMLTAPSTPRGETTSPGSNAASATAATPPPASSPSSTPTTSASDTAPAAAKIRIRIQTPAKGATAFIGDAELGPCPGTYEIDDPQGEPVAFTVKAPGYVSKTVELVPTPGQTVTIEPRPKPAPAAPIDDDLEAPY